MKKVLTLLTFVGLGLMLATPGEVLNQILAPANKRALAESLKAFEATMISYVVLLTIGFFSFPRFCGRFRGIPRGSVAYYLFFGSLGLMVEWFLLHNSPNFQDPFQVITHPGMFTFWGTLLLGPKILMESADYSPLKKRFAGYFLSFSALFLAVAIMVPRERGGIYFGFIIFALGYVGLNYFYLRYFRQLSLKP